MAVIARGAGHGRGLAVGIAHRPGGAHGQPRGRRSSKRLRRWRSAQRAAGHAPIGDLRRDRRGPRRDAGVCAAEAHQRTRSSQRGTLGYMPFFGDRSHPATAPTNCLWERFGYGPAAIEMIKEHPIDGVGVGMFHALVVRFRQAARLLPCRADNAQNWFRHVFAELGLARQRADPLVVRRPGNADVLASAAAIGCRLGCCAECCLDSASPRCSACPRSRSRSR